MEIIITAENNPYSYEMKLIDGEKKKVVIDYRPWCEANEDIIKAGIGGAGYEDLVVEDNVVSFIVTGTGKLSSTITTEHLMGKLFILVGNHEKVSY